jgi:pyridoxine kinase
MGHGGRPAVVVISSHVADGGVGSRAVVFALERLGFPVVAVPTVVLPYHPGHGAGTRIAPPEEAFAALLADLAALDRPVAAVLSGYLGAAGQAEAVAEFVGAVKARNPGALYLVDPVLGDDGRLYMPAAVLAAVRDILVPLADMATPNRFELAFLTGWKATDNAGLVEAARQLGPAEVVVTSAFAAEGAASDLLVAADGIHLATHRSLAAAPHGTGDLLAAVYLARRLDGATPPQALEKAAAATLALIERAAATGVDELPLAEGQDALLAPPAGIRLTRLDETI